MIKQGDRFTSLDLQQSMREICSYDMHKYINQKQSDTIVAIGNCAIAPSKCTPDEYAKTCIRGYADIPSSAKHLDQQLIDKGFKTTRKFSYRYRNGGLGSEQIVYDAYRLDWFFQIYQTAMPREQYQDEYIKALDDAFHISCYYAQYLWAQNYRITRDIAKALNRPDASQWAQIISVLLGIGFQFHPHDVYEYAIKHTSPDITQKQFNARHAEQLAFKNEMRNNYGINTGCLVLSPQSREKLRKIVTRTDTPYCIQVIKNVVLGHNR
ncbi:MAG: hypothetical protein K2L95_04725 [Alphaproteobacteria bacterium]|nr:hypothetical protein [Alphaproteobacteria bacterium]